MVDWTEEKIAALPDDALKNLLANAERKQAADIAELCKAELQKRNALRPRREAKPRSELKEFEHQVAGELAEVGRRMAEKYDLSEATAKAKSAGVKGFKAHRLLDSKGYAKLGGAQRNGSVAIDRYISYRLGNNVVSLGVWLPKDLGADAHEFHVSAPAAMIDGGKSYAEVRPGIAGTELQAGMAIRTFKDLTEAAGVFDAALAKITA